MLFPSEGDQSCGEKFRIPKAITLAATPKASQESTRISKGARDQSARIRGITAWRKALLRFPFRRRRRLPENEAIRHWTPPEPSVPHLLQPVPGQPHGHNCHGLRPRQGDWRFPPGFQLWHPIPAPAGPPMVSLTFAASPTRASASNLATAAIRLSIVSTFSRIGSRRRSDKMAGAW